MPSVDVVSQVDLQTLDNAINNAKREIATRYDFRNIKTEITLNPGTPMVVELPAWNSPATVVWSPPAVTR